MLFIKDETANTLLITLDNNGQIAWGNGAPVNQFTINGTGVIDADGNITNQRVGSSAIAPNVGIVSVAPGQSVNVVTTTGVIPTVSIDATWPNVKVTHIVGPPARCETTPIYSTPSHKVTCFVGFFRVSSLVQPDETGFCSNPISDTVTYRWM